MNGKIEQLIISEQYEEAWFAIAAYEKKIVRRIQILILINLFA